jgi:predicted RNase H-like nuclease (RuvC/YqgF family)
VGIELGQVLAIGGPTSVVTAIFVILVNAYLSARKDKREEKAADTQNDGAIVDNAKKVIDLVRGETERMDKRILALGELNATLEARIRKQDQLINEQDDKLARQDRQIEWLTQDLQTAHRQIEELRGGSSGPTRPD